VWRCALVFGLHVSTDRTYLASDTRFDSILLGCALAVGLNPVVDKHRGSDGLWKHWLFPAGLALLLFTFVYRAEWFRETLRYTLQGIGLIPVFVTAMRFPDWAPFHFLNRKWVAFFGELTYSLYLLHHVVLYTVRAHLPELHPVLQGVLGLASLVAFAGAIYRFVARPFARVRRRFGPAERPVRLALREAAA